MIRIVHRAHTVSFFTLVALTACGQPDGGGRETSASQGSFSASSTGGGSGETSSGGEGSSEAGSGSSGSSAEESSSGGTRFDMGGGSSTGGIRLDVGSGEGGTGPSCVGDQTCPQKIDLLFVIDNSGTMAEEQANLANNFSLLVDQLNNLMVSGQKRYVDVNMMVTTTDFGNPAWDPFREGGPEKGAPVATPCTDRLDRFDRVVDYDDMMQPIYDDRADVCTAACTTGARPMDQFINFVTDDLTPNNVTGGTVADALSCIGPQGIDGCGYEAPLENMLQALNEGACWNDPMKAGCETSGYTRPFLRDDATLGIVVVTDEEDCSLKNFSVMNDANYQEVEPNEGVKRQSSAICWNAGVVCDPPDANGVYPACRSAANDLVQPTSRYTTYLINQVREGQDKEVVMLGILGVPLVTEHNPDPPYQPTAGGVFDLVYRDWRPGAYPTGDILPADTALGHDAAYKEWEFSIGPGCTGEDGMGGFTGQAVPPVRVKEVCEALNFTDANGDEQIRCCIESICDTDFSDAIRCLTGIIETTFPPPG